MNELLVVVAGLLSGFLSGLFGIGGGLLLTPFIRIVLGKPDVIALGTTLPVIIPSAVFGLLARKGRGYFCREVFLSSSLGILPGALVGSFLTAFVKARFLLIVTSLIIIFVGLRLFFSRKSTGDLSSRKNERRPDKKVVLFYRNATLGFLAGLFSGLLGLGGGLILIPGFLLVSGLSAHEATATSLGVILVSVLPGSVVHYWLGHIDWRLAVYLSFLTPVGAVFGSRLNMKVRNRILEVAFGAFLCLIGLYFLAFEVGM